MEVKEPKISPPKFAAELRGKTHVYEGQTAHFECQVEPLHDPNLRIEFYHNGKALQSAWRSQVAFDFGYVSLHIQHCVPEDAGEYSVKAINALGQCTSAISMTVTAKGSIISKCQWPQGLEKIRELESAEPFKRREIPEPVTSQRPMFTQPLQNIDNIQEGQTAHFKCRLIPVGDQTLKVEWFRNEKLIEDSWRITKTHHFGYVSMSIAHVRDEDEGVYMCRVSNLQGEAITTAAMRIKTKAAIQMDTQHPEGIKKIQQLEQPQQRKPDQPEREFEKPIFTQVLTGPSELWEGQHAHYEARVVPVGDPNEKLNPPRENEQLVKENRHREGAHHFAPGAPSEPTVVRAMAQRYQDHLETEEIVDVQTQKRPKIPDPSVRPSTVHGKEIHVTKQTQTQNNSFFNIISYMYNLQPYIRRSEAPADAPALTPLRDLVVFEGRPAQFKTRVTSKVKPTIQWLREGALIPETPDFQMIHDGDNAVLLIGNTYEEDSGTFTCRATTAAGQAETSAKLVVKKQKPDL